ncbi:Scr1 family TA system antitoxin-like transcriptional regulator [Streptomyces sp. NPDC005955]|uniref:helix-turn-helix domain-containing protein n=1 Tax=Streptomyces sp. NPDC005955 TaxID=3364738 RepID=UPI00368D4D26
MVRGQTTVARRQLGRNLRQLRQAAGMTKREAADRLEWSESKIWRIEGGRTPLRSMDVQNMCTVYGADEAAAALMGLAQESKTRAWWHSYNAPGFNMYASLEETAWQIDTYEGDLVPGLLQTPDYVRAIVRSHYPTMADEEVETRVDIRMARQRILTRTEGAPKVRVALDETALRRPIGGAAVMAAQIGHLVYVAGVRRASIRVVPLSVGAHPGVLSGSFVMMRFPTVVGGEPTTVYGDTLTSGYYLDKDAEVEQYGAAFASIWSMALDEDASSRVLAEAARSYQET